MWKSSFSVLLNNCIIDLPTVLTVEPKNGALLNINILINYLFLT